jgi:hypothetical protein
MDANLLRDLYGMGFCLIPCGHKSKRPVMEWKIYQEARPSWVETCEWYKPDLNWAIVCGKVSDLAVVDVDPRNGGDLNETIRELGAMDCLTVLTGGGGWHLYFKLYGRELASCSSWRPGVDLQAEGKYVIAPGSIHPSGNAYSWESGELPGIAPDILWTPRRRPAPTETRGAVEEIEPWVAQAMAHPELVEAGNQNDTLNRLAWYFARRVDEDIGVSTLVNWGRQLVNYDTSWCWTEGEIRAHVERVYEDWRKKQPEQRVRIKVGAGVKQESEKINPLLSRTRGPSAFMQERGADVEWIAEDFLAPGCMTEILGSVKSGKSTWICGLLWALANGEQWLGRATRKVKVLYVTEQEGKSMQATLKRGRLEGLTDQDIEILTMRDLFEVQGGWPRQVECMVEAAQTHGCKLIVIDTLARLAGLVGDEENSAGKAAETTAPFGAAKVAGLAVAFLRHGRKSGGNVSDMGRGSSAFSGDVDVIVGLTQKGRNHKVMEVKGRLSEPFDEYLKYEGGTYVVTQNPKEVEAEGKDEEARTVITTILCSGRFTIMGIIKEAARSGVTLGRKQVTRLLEDGNQSGGGFHKIDGKWGLRPVVLVGGTDA